MSCITDNYKRVIESINNACIQYSQFFDINNLVVVTKGQSLDRIIDVVHAGAKIIGENYPEESIEKLSTDLYDLSDVKIHMIGHLQSRKIKLLNPIFSMIHSVDSIELCNKLDSYYGKINKRIDILLEVNIAGEVTKAGFDASNPEKRRLLHDCFQNLLVLKNLNIRGLMTMPPYVTSGFQNYKYFLICKELQISLQNNVFGKSFSELSMGTSTDYIAAIKAGATYIRVGEAIMGERNYSH